MKLNVPQWCPLENEMLIHSLASVDFFFLQSSKTEIK